MPVPTAPTEPAVPPLGPSHHRSGWNGCPGQGNEGYHDIYTGWWLTHPSEKYELVSWDEEIRNIWKHKTCSKPPTSIQ